MKGLDYNVILELLYSYTYLSVMINIMQLRAPNSRRYQLSLDHCLLRVCVTSEFGLFDGANAANVT